MARTPVKIPVNLVTGFLGVGKTTAIHRLLARRPDAERWAVLVNEIGEIGVDGALLAGRGVMVEEVAGGCLCCVAAPAFTTGLNRLIRRHRPDRVLIEPSGLGHPARVLDTLTGPPYADVLEVRATLCLMDARHLASPRHREHPNFQDQIQLADVLVGNKADCYGDAERAAFTAFAASLAPAKQRLALVTRGRLDPAWLDLGRSRARRAVFPEAHAALADRTPAGPPPASRRQADWLLIEGLDDGFHRAGWLIRQHRPWSAAALARLLAAVAVERCKGLFCTERGWLACNQADWRPCDAPGDGLTRLELFDAQSIDSAALDARLRRLAGAPGA